MAQLFAGDGSSVLIMGAHPDEAARFTSVFPNRQIVYWNFDYQRDAGGGEFVDECFEPGPIDTHIFVDFNNFEQFKTALQGRTFSDIWFDKGVIGYTRWTKEYWNCLLGALKPEGQLVFDMKLFLDNSFMARRFYTDFPQNNEGRRLGWSHTVEELVELFLRGLTPEDAGVVWNSYLVGEVSGYYTYECKNPFCSLSCYKQPSCLTSSDERTDVFAHDDVHYKGECGQALEKICSHDQHRCEDGCYRFEEICRQWDQLLANAEKAFYPEYVQFVQQFLGEQYCIQAYEGGGCPFALSSEQQESTSHLVKVTLKN